MWEDPIVAEIHRIREQLAAAHGYDVQAYVTDLRRRQVALGSRLVSPKQQTTLTPEPTIALPISPPDSAPAPSTPAH